jgi:hypothetical protein
LAARESQAGPLHLAAERIVARYLSRGLTKDVQIVSASPFHPGRGVDITCVTPDGDRRAIKVKADPYCGTDPGMIADRRLPFYRADTGSFAFESVANASTKEPGWMLGSQADDLYYYYLALAQEEDEVSALLREPDDLLFSELRVECDDLIILPMAETRRWFEANAEKYPPRPVFAGGAPSWHRLVPRADIQGHLLGARIIGSVFPALVR